MECTNNEATKLLTDVVSVLDNGSACMAQFEALLEQLQYRLRHECRRIKEIRKEMASPVTQTRLMDAYNRYRDLLAELDAKREAIDKLVGTIGPDHMLRTMKEDPTDLIGDTVEIAPSVADYRKDLPLWEAMKQILIDAQEMRENELLLFLSYLGFRTSPAAIQSALRTHQETFKVRNEGRKKSISLRTRRA